MKKFILMLSTIFVCFIFVNKASAATLTQFQHFRRTYLPFSTYFDPGEIQPYDRDYFLFSGSDLPTYIYVRMCATGYLMYSPTNIEGVINVVDQVRIGGNCSANGNSNGSYFVTIYRVSQYHDAGGGSHSVMFSENLQNIWDYQVQVTVTDITFGNDLVYSTDGLNDLFIDKIDNLNDKMDTLNKNQNTTNSKLDDLQRTQNATNNKLDDVNKNQQQTNKELGELNDNLTDNNSDGAKDEAGNFFSGFETDTFGLTSIITAPLDLIGSITSGSCSPLPLQVPFVDGVTLNLPCMETIYENYFGSFLTIYRTITFGIVAYWVCIKVFNLVKDFKNPDHDEIEVLDL